MANLSSDEVTKVANLAKLNLSQKDLSTLKPQLSEVITFFDQLGEIDTGSIDPTSQTTGLENVYREDEIKSNEILTQEEALSGTENTKNGYVMVPKILTQKDEI